MLLKIIFLNKFVKNNLASSGRFTGVVEGKTQTDACLKFSVEYAVSVLMFYLTVARELILPLTFFKVPSAPHSDTQRQFGVQLSS